MVQFVTTLPFHLPLRQGLVSLQANDTTLCVYRFFDIDVEESLGIKDFDVPPVVWKRSRVEMTYVTAEDVDVVHQEIDVRVYFEPLLKFLNYLIVGYVTKTRDFTVHRVSEEMLLPYGFFLCRMLNNWDDVRVGGFLLHNRMPNEKDELSVEDVGEIMRHADLLNRQLNPFLLQEELMMLAYRSLHEGAYRNAVLDAQTAIEQLLTTIHRELLRIDGNPDQEIQRIHEDTPFSTLVKTRLQQWLGGRWDTTDVRSDTGRWWQQTYELRGRIIHAAYLPTIVEAHSAVDAAESFRFYVMSLVQKKKKRYADIAKHFTISS